MRGLDYALSVPSTHGIQLSGTTITLEGLDRPVRLNFWDFGGQEIYHGSHALFSSDGVRFVVCIRPIDTRCPNVFSTNPYELDATEPHSTGK